MSKTWPTNGHRGTKPTMQTIGVSIQNWRAMAKTGKTMLEARV